MSSLMHAVTANRLEDGVVVFWSKSGWAEAFPDAELFSASEPAAAVLEQARAKTTELVDPYVIDIRLEGDEPVPTSYRERVRALGPTIHPDLGKQALGGPVVAAIQRAAGAARSTGRLSLIRRK